MSTPGVRTDAQRTNRRPRSEYCLGCRKPLSGKQWNFCSSACKAKHHREERDRQIHEAARIIAEQTARILELSR